MIFPENPCKCGESLCDRTHFVQCAAGIYMGQSMDVESIQEALDALRQASGAVLAALDDDVAEEWFSQIRNEIAARRKALAN